MQQGGHNGAGRNDYGEVQQQRRKQLFNIVVVLCIFRIL